MPQSRPASLRPCSSTEKERGALAGLPRHQAFTRSQQRAGGSSARHADEVRHGPRGQAGRRREQHAATAHGGPKLLGRATRTKDAVCPPVSICPLQRASLPIGGQSHSTDTDQRAQPCKRLIPPAKMVPERLELATLPTTYVTILTIVLFLSPSGAPAALM